MLGIDLHRQCYARTNARAAYCGSQSAAFTALPNLEATNSIAAKVLHDKVAQNHIAQSTIVWSEPQENQTGTSDQPKNIALAQGRVMDFVRERRQDEPPLGPELRLVVLVA